jgi:DNA replication protein DnaC
MRLKLAGLPAVKTLEQFDFAFQPSLDEGNIRDHTLRLLGQGQNVILLGPPRCGKTHLATSLRHAAITAGEMVHFTTARELFAKLRKSTSADVQFRRRTAIVPNRSSSTKSVTSRWIILLQRSSFG